MVLGRGSPSSFWGQNSDFQHYDTAGLCCARALLSTFIVGLRFQFVCLFCSSSRFFSTVAQMLFIQIRLKNSEKPDFISAGLGIGGVCRKTQIQRAMYYSARFTAWYTGTVCSCCCCCCCSHINSNNQVHGHRTGSSHSGAEEYPSTGRWEQRDNDTTDFSANTSLNSILFQNTSTTLRSVYVHPNRLSLRPPLILS